MCEPGTDRQAGGRGLLSVLLFLHCFLLLPAVPGFAGSFFKVVSVSGEVTLQQAGEDSWVPLAQQTVIFPGARLSSLQGTALLKSEDGTTVQIENYTEVRFTSPDDNNDQVIPSSISVLAGEMRLDGNPAAPFFVMVPSGWIDYRGGKLTIEFLPGRIVRAAPGNPTDFFLARTGERIALLPGESYILSQDSVRPDLVSGFSDDSSYQDSPDNSVTTKEITRGTLSISQPLQGDFYNDPLIPVKGRASPGAVVNVGDREVYCDTRGFFSIPLLFKEGENTLRVSEKGSGDDIRITFTVDSKKPSFKLANPVPEVTRNREISFTVLTEPGSRMRVDGKEIKGNGGLFDVRISLQEGLNRILLVIEDRAGNTSEKELTITLDSIPPILAISQVVVDNSTGNLMVAGYTDPGAAVTVNQYPLEVRPDGSFYDVINWVSGNDITFEARDEAGNINREVRTPTGISDRTPPQFLSLVFNPAVVNSGQSSVVNVTLNATDQSGLVNSTALTLVSDAGRTISTTLSLASSSNYTGTLVVDPDLPAGTYRVTNLILTDIAGNNTSVTTATTLTLQ